MHFLARIYNSSDNSDEINVHIISVDGKLIETFDIRNYASGMYILRINNKGVVTNRRLIKN